MIEGGRDAPSQKEKKVIFYNLGAGLIGISYVSFRRVDSANNFISRRCIWGLFTQAKIKGTGRPERALRAWTEEDFSQGRVSFLLPESSLSHALSPPAQWCHAESWVFGKRLMAHQRVGCYVTDAPSEKRLGFFFGGLVTPFFFFFLFRTFFYFFSLSHNCS